MSSRSPPSGWRSRCRCWFTLPCCGRGSRRYCSRRRRGLSGASRAGHCRCASPPHRAHRQRRPPPRRSSRSHRPRPRLDPRLRSRRRNPRRKPAHPRLRRGQRRHRRSSHSTSRPRSLQRQPRSFHRLQHRRPRRLHPRATSRRSSMPSAVPGPSRHRRPPRQALRPNRRPKTTRHAATVSSLRTWVLSARRLSATIPRAAAESFRSSA